MRMSWRHAIVFVVAMVDFTDRAFALDAKIPSLYIAGKFGVSFMAANDIANTTTLPAGTTPATPTKNNVHNAVMPLGGAIGYNWERHGISLRTEVEYLYRTNFRYEANPTFTNAGTPTSFTSYLASQTVLFNAYYDIKTKTRFTPYIGGGLGLAVNDTTTDGKVLATGVVSRRHRTDTNFAWNVSGGLAFNLTDHVILDVNYRYTDLGAAVWFEKSSAELTAKNLYSNELLFGARYQF